MRIASIVSRSIRATLQFLLVGIRPLLGPALCNFTPGCTDYAVQQLQEKRLIPALIAITRRVLSCNPWYKPYKK